MASSKVAELAIISSGDKFKVAARRIYREL